MGVLSSYLGRGSRVVFLLLPPSKPSCAGTSCFGVGPWFGRGLFIPCGAGGCVGVVITAAEVLGVFWRLSSTLNTPSDLAWTSAMSYGKFRRRWSASIDPGCRLRTNEPVAWTESALWTSDMTSRKRERYSRGDSSAAYSKRSRSRMVFCCFRTPAYCLRKSLQKSSNPFMDFSGSCLNHNRAGPARVVEKTLQVTASSLVSKVIFCWKWYMWSRGSVFPSNGLKVGVVKSLGLGSIWIQSAKAIRLMPRTVYSARSSGGFHSVFRPLPPWFGKVSTGFAVPPASVTRTGREPLPTVGFRTPAGLLRQNLPSAGSYLHWPADPRGEHYLCVPLRPRPLDPGWPRGPSLPFCLFPPGRQAPDPASVPDLVVPLGSFLRHQDGCSWLSFLKVPSDVVWLFCSRRARLRVSHSLFHAQPVFSQTAPNCWSGFPPVVHVSLTADAGFSNCSRILAISKLSELQARSERRGWLPAKTLRCLSQWFIFVPLGLLTPTTVEVWVAIPRQQTLGASDRQLSWLGSDWQGHLGSVVGTLGLLTLMARPRAIRVALLVVHDSRMGPTGSLQRTR
ncbi:hypothetical protein PanWU01x14_206930 [Parasponia andersonii]|uniref:Uncharacterized protein n=1 Tax=Parasponia andersonii TaxID=3476 RepID=A0A2P5BVC9_PARAD|nr:hypothetical protein PanWU01x14_206930 [Parasponia andersonii]